MAGRRRAGRTHRTDGRAPADRGSPALHRGNAVRGSEPRERFRHLDAYRVRREWRRYEGTAQRELFRQLRERFLARHAAVPGRTLEIGPGPGRFTDLIGTAPRERVALDLSAEALATLRRNWAPPGRTGPPPGLVRADALSAPFRPRSFRVVTLLGNVLGFAGAGGDSLLGQAAALLTPGGRLLLEADCGPGERSRYLARLPAGAVRRLLVAPAPWLQGRIAAEGFAPEPPRRALRGLRRTDPQELLDRLSGWGLELEEAIAVAPVLGADSGKLETVHTDRRAWERLLSLEETVGRSPERLRRCPAVLFCAKAAEAQD